MAKIGQRVEDPAVIAARKAAWAGGQSKRDAEKHLMDTAKQATEIAELALLTGGPLAQVDRQILLDRQASRDIIRGNKP